MSNPWTDVPSFARWSILVLGGLVALAGCGDDSPMEPQPTEGTVEVSATTTGSDQDSDGYTVTLDGGNGQALDPNGTVTFSEVSTGEASVELTGVSSNCSVSGGATRTVQVQAGQTASVAYEISCSQMTGDLQISASTSGQDQDPDGYRAAYDGPAGTDTLDLAVDGDTTVTDLDAGDYTVELLDVANNCTVDGGDTQTVSVPADGTGSAAFEVSCSDATGSLEATATTTGQDQDEDGYTVEVNGTQSQAIGVNGTVTFSGLATGDHDVELTGVAANCSVSGSNPRTVTVSFGDTVSTGFDVSCTSTTGSLEATATTTGQDLDQDGYEVVLDPGSASPDTMPLAVNGDTVTFTGVTSSDHELELTGIRDNCSVSGDNPRTVTVVGDDTVSTTFDVSCANRTGDLEVTASNPDGPTDSNGFEVAIDGPAGPDTLSLASNSTETFAGLDEGDYTVELIDVASNCSVSGNNPRTVSVAFDSTSSTTFDVDCFAPLSNQIVFESDLDEPGNLDIYVMNPDGTGVIRLTTDAADDRTPAVSPDGAKIVFQSKRDGSNDLWIMNADGSGKRQLTDGNDFNPDWSPQGGFITFQRIFSGNGDIFFINEDGSQLTNLTASPGDDDITPAWSPDGTEIAFASDADDFDGDGTFDYDIYIMENDGSNPTAVTTNDGAAQYPQWDPSSCGGGGPCQRLAFFGDRDGNAGEIFRIQRDGTGEVNLTNDPVSDQAPDYQPAWSPDGSTIVFVSERDGNAEIWSMNFDGSGASAITGTTGVANKNPDWSP